MSITNSREFTINVGKIAEAEKWLSEGADLWKEITGKSSPNGGLRILVSRPIIGPTRSLSQFLSEQKINQTENTLLQKIIEVEDSWIVKENKEEIFLAKLHELGWSLAAEEWEENLSLRIDQNLEKRWLAEDSLYSQFLQLNGLTKF